MVPGVTATTRVAAVIGDPVEHSRSPSIFNAAFGAAGIDWVYAAFTVPAGGGADAVKAMRTLGIAGLSVTMPHKAEVIPALDHLSDEADRLGAVNCITNSDGVLTGHNTDGAGYVASLRAQGVDPSGMRCVVVGAGGAARAVIHALGRSGATEVVVCNRNAERGSVAAGLAATGRSIGHDELGDALASADLLVNATPLGMGPEDPPVVPAEKLFPALVVSDLVYEPLRTPLLEAAETAGCRTVGGLGMLVHQAAVAFELMTKLAAPVDVMAAAAGFAAEN